VLADADKVIAVPNLDGPIKSAKLLNGAAVDFTATKLGTIVVVPDKGRDPNDTVIEVVVGK
jgi:hypothetical protein